MMARKASVTQCEDFKEPQVDLEQSWLLEVTDLKQFAYCPRIVYYRYCLPLLRYETYKMQAGVAAHDRAEVHEQRRSLRAYQLDHGERHFNVPLSSHNLGLSGRVDLVIALADDEARPVDYKLSRFKPGLHFRMQLAAYAALLEACWSVTVKAGYIYLIPLRKAELVVITPRLRSRMRQEVSAIREMIDSQALPDPPRQRVRCVNCEFRRFCNDVL